MAYLIGIPLLRLSLTQANLARSKSRTQSIEDLTSRCIITIRKRKQVFPMRTMIKRRSWHLSAGLGIAFAAWFLPTTAMLISLGLVTFIFLAFEFIRLKVPSMNRWFFSHFGSLLREEETSRVTTSSYVLVAELMAYLAFGRDIAVLSVCFLAVGDVAAGIVGRYIGRTRLFGKGLGGELACVVAV